MIDSVADDLVAIAQATLEAGRTASPVEVELAAGKIILTVSPRESHDREGISCLAYPDIDDAIIEAARILKEVRLQLQE